MSKRLYRREFLNDEQNGGSAHIIVDCDSTVDKYGSASVSIGDCGRTIELYFGMGDREECRNSLRKINLLIDALTEFEVALQEKVKKLVRKGFD